VNYFEIGIEMTEESLSYYKKIIETEDLELINEKYLQVTVNCLYDAIEAFNKHILTNYNTLLTLKDLSDADVLKNVKLDGSISHPILYQDSRKIDYTESLKRVQHLIDIGHYTFIVLNNFYQGKIYLVNNRRADVISVVKILDSINQAFIYINEILMNLDGYEDDVYESDYVEAMISNINNIIKLGKSLSYQYWFCFYGDTFETVYEILNKWEKEILPDSQKIEVSKQKLEYNNSVVYTVTNTSNVKESCEVYFFMIPMLEVSVFALNDMHGPIFALINHRQRYKGNVILEYYLFASPIEKSELYGEELGELNLEGKQYEKVILKETQITKLFSYLFEL